MNNLVQTLNTPSLPKISNKNLSIFTGFFIMLFLVSMVTGTTTQNETVKIAAVFVTTFSSAFLACIVMLVLLGAAFLAPAEPKGMNDCDEDDYFLTRGGITKDFILRCQERDFVWIDGYYVENWDESVTTITFYVGENQFPLTVSKDHLQYAKYGNLDGSFIIECPGVDSFLEIQFQ